ncbi:MAG: putative DNA base hypermodification protein, partial [Gammaproteobacteria bacterium]|nr:putative DNA base hypermodification protein [Gammaproteobacteria bacterium]
MDDHPLDIEPLLYVMLERHRIFLRRKKGMPKPWSPDPIFQNHRFCNVYRELDKVTVWIKDNLREPYKDHPYLWFFLAAARQINWPDTLAELLADKTGSLPTDGVFNPESMRSVMLARQQRGEKVYTGAYMISASSKAKELEHKDKAYFTAYKVLLPLWLNRQLIEHNLKQYPT